MKHALATDEEYSKETIEGTRLEAVENIIKYQEQTRRWRDSQVVRKLIQDGDLVLRRKPNAANAGKLQPKWEGPYTAKAAGRPGSFFLTDGEGKTATHTWNIDNLRRFYILVYRGGQRGTISEGHLTSLSFHILSLHFISCKRAYTLFLTKGALSGGEVFNEVGPM